MTKMRRFLYWAPVSLLLFTLAASFVHPHTAYAAATGEFQDASTIKVGDSIYFDSQLDTDFTYVLQGGGSSCARIHRDQGNTTSGTLYVPDPTNVGNCTSQPITFTNNGASQETFVWSGTTTIITSDGRRIYNQNSQNNSIYIETADQVTGGTGCQDSLQVTDPATSTSATLVMRTDHLSTSSSLGIDTSSYPSGVLKNAKPTAHTNGCYEFTTTVQIAPYQDPSTAGVLVHGAVTGGAGGSAGSSTPTCESSPGALNWLFCAIYKGIANGADWIFSHLVVPQLVTHPVCLDASGANCQGLPLDASGRPINVTYRVWSAFRVYGDIFLVIALLVVVFGESIGGGLIEAYTARKILPRLLAAAILINLSIYLVAGLVDLTNIVGGGIGQILTGPLSSNAVFKITPQGFGGTGVTGIIGATLLLKSASILALFSFEGGALILTGLVIPALLIVFAILATVAIRAAIIMVLIFVAPVAFALYCLPNTEKYFRKWWDVLAEMLIVYPIIVVLFAAGSILSVTIEAVNPNAGAVTSTVDAILSLVFLIAPLALIPFSFRIAGNTIGRLHDAFTAGRQKVSTMAQNRRERVKQDFGRKVITRRTGMYNRFGQTGLARGMSQAPGLGWALGRRMETLDQQSRINANDLLRDPRAQAIKDDNPALRAAVYGSYNDAVKGLQGEGFTKAESERAARAVQSSIGFGRSQAVAAHQMNINTGTGFSGHNIYKVGAGGNPIYETEADGSPAYEKEEDGVTNKRDEAGNLIRKRSVERWVSPLEEMLTSAARAAGGNASTQASLAGFSNFYTKQAGRPDMAPGFTDALNMMQRINRGGSNMPKPEEYTQAIRKGLMSMDPVSVLRGKKPGVESIANSLQQIFSQSLNTYQTADQTTAQGKALSDTALDDLKFSIAKIEQLDQNRSYASGESQNVVNKLKGQTQNSIDQVYAMLKAMPNGDKHMADIERLSAPQRISPDNPFATGGPTPPAAPEP